MYATSLHRSPGKDRVPSADPVCSTDSAKNLHRPEALAVSLNFAPTQNEIVMFKKIISGLALALALQVAQAQQLNTPQPSPTASVKQNFGLSAIEISYSRPGVKGRQVFGALVPYDAVWRTGANEGTTVTFGDDVTIGGTKVPAGTYGLLTIPGQSQWTVIISKQTNVTSPAAYKMSEDVVRVKVEPAMLPFSVETFMIFIGDITQNTCTINLVWDDVAVALPVSTDIDSKVMAQIDNLMNKDNKPYFQAAMYYMDNGKDMNQALAWLEKAAVQQPQAYWVQYQRANALAKLGKKADAVAAAKKSLEMAKAAQNSDYVRLNENLIKSLQ